MYLYCSLCEGARELCNAWDVYIVWINKYIYMSESSLHLNSPHPLLNHPSPAMSALLSRLIHMVRRLSAGMHHTGRLFKAWTTHFTKALLMLQ